MGKITLNEALKKASVKNDLQMFLGLDAQSELGGMTPERLAAVAGGNIGVFNELKNGLMDKNLYKYFPSIAYSSAKTEYIKIAITLDDSKCVFNVVSSSNGSADLNECIISTDRHVTSNQQLKCSVKKNDGNLELFSDNTAVYVKRAAYNTSFVRYMYGSSAIKVSIIPELPAEAKPLV